MGFGPAAGIAQGVTDVVTDRAQLPKSRQVKFAQVAPRSPPVWGSILDDLWAISEVLPPDVVADSCPVAGWFDEAEAAWDHYNIPLNVSKSVDFGEGSEFQGTVIDPDAHWIGVALEKRGLLFAAGLAASAQKTIAPLVVHRLAGKHGYVSSYRPGGRAFLDRTHSFLADTSASRYCVGEFDPFVWLELLTVTLFLPFQQTALDAPFCSRLECYDASPGGHGRAWCYYRENLVQDVCRYADQKAAYVSLALPFGIEVDDEEKCPLYRLELPKARHWTTIARPGGWQHITLEEADTNLWSMEHRLHRPSELGCRVGQGGDNACTVGSFAKGRSSSPALNLRCKRGAVIEFAGDLYFFHFWIRSAKNPADAPSSVYGIRAKCAEVVQPVPRVDCA